MGFSSQEYLRRLAVNLLRSALLSHHNFAFCLLLMSIDLQVEQLLLLKMVVGISISLDTNGLVVV
jgi:hypothetical protein